MLDGRGSRSCLSASMAGEEAAGTGHAPRASEDEDEDEDEVGRRSRGPRPGASMSFPGRLGMGRGTEHRVPPASPAGRSAGQRPERTDAAGGAGRAARRVPAKERSSRRPPALAALALEQGAAQRALPTLRLLP